MKSFKTVIIIMLFISIIIQYLYMNNVINQHVATIESIRDSVIVIDDTSIVEDIEPDFITIVDSSSILKLTKVINKLNSKIIVDSIKVIELMDRIGELEWLVDSVEFASDTINIENPCQLTIDYYGYPFGVFEYTFKNQHRNISVMSTNDYVKPHSIFNVGANIGYSKHSEFMWGLTMGYYYTNYGVFVSGGNYGVMIGVNRKWNFYH